MKKITLEDNQIELLKQILSTAKIPVSFGHEAASWNELGTKTMQALENAEEVPTPTLALTEKKKKA